MGGADFPLYFSNCPMLLLVCQRRVPVGTDQIALVALEIGCRDVLLGETYEKIADGISRNVRLRLYRG